jgi:hypothetical protein
MDVKEAKLNLLVAIEDFSYNQDRKLFFGPDGGLLRSQNALKVVLAQEALIRALIDEPRPPVED